MRVLVLGAAGFLGLNIVDALLASGITPRCARRRRTNVIALRKRKTPQVVADAADLAGLTQAMTGCDVVVHAAAHYPRYSLDGDAAIAKGTTQLQNVLDAAAASGVSHLIYLSSTASVACRVGGPSTEEDVFSSRPGFGVYHNLKWMMERQALDENRFRVSVACPGACLGPWDFRVGTSALLVALARGMDPPHPDGIVNIVDVRDVARAVVTMVLDGAPPKRILLSGSSHRIQPLLIRLASRYGVRVPRNPLGVVEAKRLADESERAAHAVGRRSLVSREIVDLIAHGVSIDASLAESALKVQWTPLDDTLTAFEAWARPLRILPPKPALMDCLT